MLCIYTGSLRRTGKKAFIPSVSFSSASESGNVDEKILQDLSVLDQEFDEFEKAMSDWI